MRRVLVRGLLAVALALAWAGSGHAQDDTDPKFTITNPDTIYRDLDMQGEFKGHALLSPFSELDFGLQIVSMGGGQFQGQLLIGGLPADGWNNVGKIRLLGKLDAPTDRILTMVGGAYAVTVRGTESAAVVRYQNSEMNLGNLYRVRRVSPSMGAEVPEGGTLLFDGNPEPPAPPPCVLIFNPCCPCCCTVYCPPPPPPLGTSLWENAKLTEEGLLLPGAKLKNVYENFKLHVEFRVPYMPNARGQERGNSGIYLNGRQEIQILDSYGLQGAENEAGAIYRYKAPDLNMALPPLTWQTYDIIYQAPVFNAGGKKTLNARITLKHNGIVVQDNVEVESPTGAGPAEGPNLLPLILQDHGAPVVFRNIWVAPHDAIRLPPPPPGQARKLPY